MLIRKTINLFLSLFNSWDIQHAITVPEELSGPRTLSEVCFYVKGNAVSFLVQIIICHCVTELLWPLFLKLVQFLKSNQELFEYYTYGRIIRILGHTVGWKTDFASKDFRFHSSASKCPVF
jgi:hypothetical protein